MSGSCHLDRASNDKFSVECLFQFFQPTWESDLKVVQITKNYFFWVDSPLYLECAPNCKSWPQLKKVTITNIWRQTPTLTFNPLSKWHEPGITFKNISWNWLGKIVNAICGPHWLSCLRFLQLPLLIILLENYWDMFYYREKKKKWISEFSITCRLHFIKVDQKTKLPSDTNWHNYWMFFLFILTEKRPCS